MTTEQVEHTEAEEMFDDTLKVLEAGPVSSLKDLEYKVTLALAQDVKELDVTPEVMSQLLKKDYKDSDKSFIYKNVFLYEVGTKEKTKSDKAMSMNTKQFGKSNIKIGPTAIIKR